MSNTFSSFLKEIVDLAKVIIEGSKSRTCAKQVEAVGATATPYLHLTFNAASTCESTKIHAYSMGVKKQEVKKLVELLRFRTF